MSSKRPKVEIPKYKEPAKVGFQTPWGDVGFDPTGSNFVLSQSPEQEAERLEIEALRNSILKTIGVTSPEREASLNKFEETFFAESTRLAVPKLENTLFDRGLGGSSVYQGAVRDLLSQLATESVLQRETLRNQDETTKINQLNSVDSLLANDRNAGMTLLNLAQGFNSNQSALATNRYNNTLPYAAQVTGSSSPGIGQILGAVAPLVLSAINPVAGVAAGGLSKAMKPVSVTSFKGG